MSRPPSAPTIQSISISLHSTRQSPSPHIVYEINVSTPTTHYIIPQRYSAFAQLNRDLSQEIGERPPGELPSRRRGGWFSLGGGSMSDEQLRERRMGLERWLRGLLTNRDPRWSGARCFQEFLAAPPNATSSNATGTDEHTAPILTNATWLVEHAALTEQCRSIRSKLNDRDASRLNSSSTAHSLNASAKKDLLALVTRLSAMASALRQFAEKGMLEGELNRRGEMLGRLQQEAQDLGKLANGGPRVGEGQMRASGHERDVLLTSGRSTSKPLATRVLGSGAGTGVRESAETRPLDDRGLMSLQQTYMDEQDSKLEILTAALRRQRALGEMIGEELRVHDELLDRLETSTDKVQSKLKDADKMARRL